MPKLSHTVEITNPKTGVKSDVVIEGLQSFSISSKYESLENYYRTNFVMVQHHKWDLEQLENMILGKEKFTFRCSLITSRKKMNELKVNKDN